MQKVLGRVGAWMADHPVALLVGVGLFSLLMAAAVPRVEFATSLEALVGEDSETVQANREVQETFGGEPLVLLLTADDGRDIMDLFGDDLAEMQRLVDRLGSATCGDRPCFDRILSPIDAIDFGAAQLGTNGADGLAFQMQSVVLAREGEAYAPTQAEIVTAQAPRLVAAQAEGDLVISNIPFVELIVFNDNERSDVRDALRDMFPDPRHAVILARLPPGADLDFSAEAVEQFEDIVDGSDFTHFSAVGGGPASIVRDLNAYLQGGMASLGLAALAVMALVLALVFRVRWRMLSLLVVLIGALCTFGVVAILGVPLSIITISGLPILIGIGVDFSIQVHSRFEEELDEGHTAREAVGTVAQQLLPPLFIAMLAAVLGFIALQVSASPAMREFGVLLAVGVSAMFVIGVAVPSALLLLREQRGATEPGSLVFGSLERASSKLALAGVGLFWPLVAVSAVVIAVGLSMNDSTPIQTDAEKWVPPDSETLAQLGELRTATGWSSELTLMIEAQDVTQPEVVEWLYDFTVGQREARPELVRGNSIPTIVSSITEFRPAKEETDLLIPDLPAAFRDGFINEDRTRASVIFQIGQIELSDLEALIAEIEEELDPPPGVSAEWAAPTGTEVTPAGIAILGVSVVEVFEQNRSLLTWVALAAVALWLLVAFRNLAKVVLPLIPVLTAVGLSALVTTVIGVELSPMTALTGPLIIAACTEFTVLILIRYLEERERGRSPREAVEFGVGRIGRAFIASGLTTVGGFGVLAASSYPLLRDFGILVSINVIVALLSALLILPTLLVKADRYVTGLEPEEAAA